MFETHFEKNEANKTMTVERQFAGPLDKVWKAWTDSATLEKWWAPKPWKAVTEAFDFTEGGKWLYYMAGPQGEKSYAALDFESIKPKSSFSAKDVFCNSDGTPNDTLPKMHWLNEFSEVDGTTKVKVTITFEDVESMNKIIAMGFKEGFAMAHTNLDALLAE